MSFANPVIAGFHPDPSVCRVGEDYYLACSSFEYFPACRSSTAATWCTGTRSATRWTGPASCPWKARRLLGRRLRADAAAPRRPVLADHLERLPRRHRAVHRRRPGRAVVGPGPVPGVTGFDPDLAWDEEGRCWCTYAGIEQVRIDPVTGQALGEPRRLWSGTPGAQYPEAPHLYRIGGLLVPAHRRGRDRTRPLRLGRPRPGALAGPFEPCPANPIVSHRSTARPVQSTGHGDLVQAPDGSWWMVLLGTRPRGGFPGWHVMGRETLPGAGDLGRRLAGRRRGGAGHGRAPVAAAPVRRRRGRDDFDEPRLHPRWVSVRSRPGQCWSTQDRPGWLTLRARGSSPDDTPPAISPQRSRHTFVGRRQQDLSCRVRALADAARGRGGLAVRLDERHHYEIEAAGGEVRVLARIGPLRQALATRAVPAGPVVLRVEVHRHRAGPGAPAQGARPGAPGHRGPRRQRSPCSPSSTAGTCRPRSPAASPAA